ncbi:MAG: SRPBCC domain-containing protein [Intrasporangium sp.]|uniref:SRPBCC family protein n=1 Tax=Intrasporangium sp. TaxID=1925024 RepID=UPI002649C239|nr:SRPBCC domain-containing protein [Intrasporangium sp.]MDN5794875.1 SRPBCC domain-containing protein [Intrasporangium sp.]
MTSTTESIPDEAQSRAVHVTQVVPAPIGQVWQHLISVDGTQALLGAGAQLGSKGESWHSDEGRHGVVRSYHPLEQIRVSWHADDAAPASLVDVQIAPDGDGTRIDLVHEHADDPGLHAYWVGVLGRFASGLG